MIFFCLVVLAACNVLVSSESQVSNSSLDQLKELADGTRRKIEDRITNLTEALDDKWDIVHELQDQDFDEDTTEFEGIDATGCNRKLRKHYEDRCDEQYERVNDEAQQIENEHSKIEAVCCALEDFEKCSLRAYDQAGCVTDKAAIRENLKAARLFLTVIANITCSEFRGQCAFYSSDAPTEYASYIATFVSISASLAVFHAKSCV